MQELIARAKELLADGTVARVLAWSTNVNVENSYICIRVFVTDQHCMFCSVHTADLGAVALSSFIRATASHTLYKYNVFRSFSIGKSLKMPLCR